MKREEILKILIDWNFWGNWKDTSFIREEYISRLERFIKTGEIVVIKGVRRSGKSTIISQFINKLIRERGVEQKNTLIVNFEDPRFMELSLDTLNKIYETYLDELLPDENHYVVLDEVQEVPGWEKFARFLSEAKKVNLFVTGSSSKLFSEEYSTLLSGRHIDLNVFPLSFKEFLKFNNIEIKNKIDAEKMRNKIKFLLREYIEYGGFPKVVLVEKEEKKIILQNYFQDILLKDVQRRFRIKEVIKLEDMAKYYLTNISTIQSFNRVKNILKLSLDTVERFSYYFTIAGIFFFIPKFSYSKKEQILNPRKVYSIDTGLRNVMGFRFSEDTGRLMENIVLIELKRREYEVFYWRNSQQKEVDFVVISENSKTGIQVCRTLEDHNTMKREISSLIYAKEKIGLDKLLIITEDEEGKERVKNTEINILPIWKWLLNV